MSTDGGRDQGTLFEVERAIPAHCIDARKPDHDGTTRRATDDADNTDQTGRAAGGSGANRSPTSAGGSASSDPNPAAGAADLSLGGRGVGGRVRRRGLRKWTRDRRTGERKVSVQYFVVRKLACDGFITSKELRQWGRNDRFQSAPQRVRDVPLYGLMLFQDLPAAEAREVAGRELSAAEQRRLIETDYRGGSTWILARSSRARARWLVSGAK